jgi:hypothetical protein
MLESVGVNLYVNYVMKDFPAEAWSHLQGYINMQNNRYWSSENPHLIHEDPFHPAKVGLSGVL